MMNDIFLALDQPCSGVRNPVSPPLDSTPAWSELEVLTYALQGTLLGWRGSHVCRPINIHSTRQRTRTTPAHSDRSQFMAGPMTAVARACVQCSRPYAHT
jgi:hypothetical protein